MRMKKAMSMMLIIASLITLMATPAFALATVSKQVVYMDGTFESDVDVAVTKLGPKQSIKKGSVKSSNKAVLTPSMLTYYSQDPIQKGLAYDAESYITLIAKKAGTAKISYAIGNKTYTTAVTVKKYVNPAKSITITGINSGKNVAAQFNKTTEKKMKLTANTKAGKVVAEAKSGWKITSIHFKDVKADTVRSFDYGTKGITKATLPITAMKKGVKYEIAVYYVNTKDKGTIWHSYVINP